MDYEHQEYLITPGAGGAVAVKKEMTLDQAVGLWRAVLDSDDNRDRPGRPYAQVDLVFNCVSKLIDAVQGIPLVLSTAAETIIESGPAYDILYNNPALSFEALITAAVGHYALSRDVFFVFADKEPGGPPHQVQVVSGTQMHAVTENRRPSGELVGWEFRSADGQKTELSLDKVYQWKNFNPYDRFHGIGPATACRTNINYCYAANLFNSAALENGADPGIILMLAGRQDQATRDMLRENFDARHRGPRNARRTAALSGVQDIKTVAMNMVEMQLAELSQLTGARICSTFGVPPQLVGLALEAQYSHGPAMRDFIFNTVIPLCSLAAGAITSGLLARLSADTPRGVSIKEARLYSGRRYLALSRRKSFCSARQLAAARRQKIFAWFDTDQHPVVQEYQQEVAEKMVKLSSSGVPLNQIIDAHDLPYDTSIMPWGDHWWIGMGQVPAAWAMEAGPEGITGPSLPEGQTEEEEQEKIIDLKAPDSTEDDEPRRLRIWRNWVVSWSGLEKEYAEAFRKFSLRQQRILIDRLKKAFLELATKSKQKDADQIIARVVFDLRAEDNRLRAFHKVFFNRASELGIRQSLAEAGGLEEEALEAAVESAQKMPHIRNRRAVSVKKITGVNRTTQDMVARQLRAGLAEGESLNDLTKRIQKVMGSNRKRAQRIARTETASAVSTGRHQGMAAAGVRLKTWLTSRDDQVRDPHKDAELKYADGIDINLPFEVGGENLMHPGDPAGAPANIINCRCVELARYAAGKSIDLDQYARWEFYSAAQMAAVKTALKKELMTA